MAKARAHGRLMAIATSIEVLLFFVFVAGPVCVAATPKAGGGPAVLQLAKVGSGDKPQRLPALLAEWSAIEFEVSASPVVKPDDPHGCSKQEACKNCAVFVLQGECTFSLKAQRAQEAGASMLIVASATEGSPVGMAASESQKAPKIAAAMVSKASGRKVLLALDRGEVLSVTLRKAKASYGDLLSEVVVGVVAVSLVMLGAWHSVEDLRKPEQKDRFNEEVMAVEQSSGPHFVLFGSIMLTVLFFLMKYLIYVLLLVFAMGAVSTTAVLLEPFILRVNPALRDRKAFTVPRRIANILGVAEEHSVSDAIGEAIGLVLAVAFLIYRNNVAFGWMLQDSIAIMLLITIQRSLRLPNLKVATMLLVCTFFFDIFWVFLSPLIFKKSVMIEVATGGGTGQSVPMVLKIPALSADFPGQFKILGLGDVAIPGLLISMLLRHDMTKHAGRFPAYFVGGSVGYAFGLVCTFISLYLMQHGQPALLFLVPGTLGPTMTLALLRGEFSSFWNADYGPEQPPDAIDKQA